MLNYKIVPFNIFENMLPYSGASDYKSTELFLNGDVAAVKGLRGLSAKVISGGRFPQNNLPIVIEFYRKDQLPYSHTFLTGQKVELFGRTIFVTAIPDGGLAILNVETI